MQSLIPQRVGPILRPLEQRFSALARTSMSGLEQVRLLSEFYCDFFFSALFALGVAVDWGAFG